MAIHSSILAWRNPWIEESGRLQSMGSQTVRPDWVTKHSTLILYASSMFLANFYKIFKAKKAGPNVFWILSDRWGNTGSGLLTLNPPFSYFGQCTHCEKLTCLIHSSENRSLFPCFPYSLCHDYRNQDYFKYFFFPQWDSKCVLSLFSSVRLFATLWTVALQTLSMGFSRQEYCSGLPCPPAEDFPNPGIKSTSPMSPGLAGRFFTTSATWEALW